ncbi:8220_t:CDS:2, partial [Cetraspora pellucida]
KQQSKKVSLTKKHQQSHLQTKSSMTVMEKLKYNECKLLLVEQKEKLRELQIANAIKKQEYDLVK